jgi:hypothetical protein
MYVMNDNRVTNGVRRRKLFKLDKKTVVGWSELNSARSFGER